MEVCAAGKSEWEGRMGFTYGSFIKRFCALGWALAGVIVLGLVAQGTLAPLAHREDAFGTAIRALLPSGFIGLMLAAILAAQMSSLSAFMVAASALLSRNIYLRHLNPAAGDATVVRFARWSGLGVVALGMWFAFIVPGVADALTIFWTITTFTGVLVWAGFLWRRTTTTGAWAAFLVMVGLWVLFGPLGAHLKALWPAAAWLGQYGDKTQLHLLMLSYLPAGLVALVVGSLLSRPAEKKKLDDFYTLMKTPVGMEDKLEAQGVRMIYSGETEGHPWETKHPRLVNGLGFAAAMAVSLSFFGLLWLLGVVGA
jgi:Na+/proline symporter